MNYESIEYDFIDRTLKILKQYDSFKHTLPDPEQYEVTLLINSLLGLLLFPQQLASDENNGRFKDWLTGEKFRFIDVAQHWALSEEYIVNFGYKPESMGKDEKCKDKTPEVYDRSKFTMRNLVKALRNSAAHRRFEAISNGDEITHIKFTNSANFHMEIPTKSLREFIRRLAESALNQLD